jgi:hypothetical protein
MSAAGDWLAVDVDLAADTRVLTRDPNGDPSSRG